MTFFHLQTFCFSHSFLSKYFRLLTLRGSALRKRIFTVVFGGIPITKIVFASSRVPIFLISSMRLFSVYRKRSLIGSMHVFMLPMMTFSFFSPLTQSSSPSPKIFSQHKSAPALSADHTDEGSAVKCLFV